MQAENFKRPTPRNSLPLMSSVSRWLTLMLRYDRDQVTKLRFRSCLLERRISTPRDPLVQKRRLSFTWGFRSETKLSGILNTTGVSQASPAPKLGL